MRKDRLIKYYFFRMSVAVVIVATIFLPLSACYCQPERPRSNRWHRHAGDSDRGRANPGPMSVEEIRKLLDKAGGKIVSLSNGGFFLEWFPENWNSLKTRYIIISLHGSGGHAERMFNLWYRNRSYHDYAIIALQYAETDAQDDMRFQNCHEIYQNLRSIVEHIGKADSHISNNTLILHGFSRGAARIFELAALDRAANGMHVFAAFIIDSGSSLAENQGELSPFLDKLSRNAYNGARFWLYTGAGDHGGRTCIDLRKMSKFITDHGGKVDDLFIYDTNQHGILITGGPYMKSKALNALFTYINGIKPIKEAVRKK